MPLIAALLITIANVSIALALLVLLCLGVLSYFTLRMSRPTVTDSPWYWLAMFCGFGLLGLGLIGPKFHQREAGLELEYEGRTEMHRRQLDPARQAKATIDDRGDNQMTTEVRPASERELLETLVPLYVLTLGGLTLAATMLRRQWLAGAHSNSAAGNAREFPPQEPT